MKINYSKIALLSVISCAAVSAQAKDGFSVGVFSSNGTFSHTIERDTGTNETPSITTRAEETDFGYGLSVGYQLPITNSAFIGAELFYQDQDITTRNVNNLLVTELNLTASYGIKLKSGFNVNDKLDIYGFAGQTTLDFDIENTYPFAPPVTNEAADVDEFTIGVGLEYTLNDHWSIVAEYSQLNDSDFDPIPEVAVPGKINDNEVDYSALSFGVTFSF